ncbi:MAG: outer membrane lipid asymmetry maintenance protein MlaD [Glaciecola sp.]|jgi:phospholipid/cholesterol/gamma-HCH transport system substrate-binding protein|nr:outer membrane lipid asymmetry maintenance protein MlaD [Glaciecola sp.]MDG2100541.1 outer membrane lipid asymmetry maintenance protein MlaD [Glaciecola sp.]
MTTRKTELMVGLFVILTIAAGLLLAFKVVNQGFSDSESTYTLYAKFDNIGGLQTRSAVKVGGVTVGRVESIYLDPEDFNPIVVISLSDKYNNFPDTSSASILTSGLLGEQYIGFQPGFAFDDFVVLADGDYIQDTKSALVLEDLIGQFLFSRDSE